MVRSLLVSVMVIVKVQVVCAVVAAIDVKMNLLTLK